MYIYIYMCIEREIWIDMYIYIYICVTIPYHTIPYHTIPYHTIPGVRHRWRQQDAGLRRAAHGG